VIRIKKFIPLITFFFFLFIILSFSHLSSGFNLAFDFLKLPLKIFLYPGNIIKEILLLQETYDENSRLKQENAILNYKMSRILNMKHENIRLEELLGLKSQSSFNLVAATVIARDPDNWTSTLIIDKGQEANIREDSVVIGQKGLVGIVSDIGLTTSRIVLINDPNFNCAALLRDSRVHGLLSGSIFGGCRLRFLSQEDDVAIGDVVITSGLTLEVSSSLFPKGIVIGKVKFIAEESSGLGKYCLVETIERLEKLEEVLVIIP